MAQEKRDLRSSVLALEERVATGDNDTNVLQEKVLLLTEEKTAVENEMALLRESLQTSEKEKQVRYN